MKPLQDQGELHEVLLTREDVQGCQEPVKRLIHTYLNCVVVHPGECHLKAQHSLEGKLACVRQILYFASFECLSHWLNEMQSCMRSSTPTMELLFLEKYQEELELQIGLYRLHSRLRQKWNDSKYVAGVEAFSHE